MTWPNIKDSISFRLSLYVACCLSVVLALGEFIDYRIIKSDVRNNILAEQLNAATNMAHTVQRELEERTHFIEILAKDLGDHSYTAPSAASHHLQQALQFTTAFSDGAVIITPSGQGVMAQHPHRPARQNLLFTHSPWFIQALEGNGVIVSNAFLARDTKRPIIVIAKSIRKVDGTISGVLAAPVFLDESTFLGPLYDAKYRRHGDFLLISRQQKIFLAASDATLVLKPTPAIGLNTQHDKNMAGFNGTAIATTATGERVLSGIQDIPGTDWFLVARDNADNAFRPLDTHLRNLIAPAIAFVITAFVVTFVALYTFFAPLRHTAKIVRNMGKNDIPLHTLPVRHNDEIGNLVSGINSLVHTVQEQNRTLQNTNNKLETLSRTDALTQLHNRRWFDETLKYRWRSHMRQGTPMSMIMLDIDYFKYYNDTYGHAAGDNCLRTVAQTLQSLLRRPDDFVARYGGEEFVVLLNDDLEHARMTAERLRRGVADLHLPHATSENGLVTISLGVATCIPERDHHAEDLIKSADTALYASKTHGRNCVHCS